MFTLYVTRVEGEGVGGSRRSEGKNHREENKKRLGCEETAGQRLSGNALIRTN